MSDTPDADVPEGGPVSPVPRAKRSPLTIIAIVVAAVLVLGGAAFATVMIVSQQQRLDQLSQVEADRVKAEASASAAAAAAARAAAVPGLTESIASGETAYTDSKGHVSDEALRAALRAALDAGAAALADGNSVAESLKTAKANIDNAVKAVADAHIAVWADINGTWCGEIDTEGHTDCRTITNLHDPGDSDSHYVQEEAPKSDANGCLWGYTGGAAEPRNAAVTYCPKGIPLVDTAALCHIPEDVTRDRLYVRNGCPFPAYRQ